MPRAKIASASANDRVNKSAWIRNQPVTMPAKEVLRKAKAEGISLALAQVYTARSKAKPGADSAGAYASSATTSVGGADGATNVGLRADFQQLVLRLGTDKAQKLLRSLLA